MRFLCSNNDDDERSGHVCMKWHDKEVASYAILRRLGGTVTKDGLRGQRTTIMYVYTKQCKGDKRTAIGTRAYATNMPGTRLTNTNVLP